MKRKVLLMVLVLVVAVSMVSFAGGQQEAASEGGMYVGISNGQVTNTWRTQMISDLVQELSYYEGQGIVGKYKIQHAGTDVDTQIAQLRNFISDGVDLIVINPLSGTALVPVLEEAVDMGIVVVTCDQQVESDMVYKVVPDQYGFQRDLTTFVIKQMGGKGNAFYMSGIDGQPLNTDRDQAVYDLLEEYPDINLLTKVNGNWDNTTAKQVTADVLAAFPTIDGVLTQDGMCVGIVEAFESAGRPIPPMSGSATVSFLEKWIELKNEKGFKTVAYINGPGFTANLALGIGVRMVMGKELRDDVFTDKEQKLIKLSLPEITNSTVEDVYAEHLENKGIADFIDGWYSQKKIDSMFIK
jgi:ribose transport system substrate-binding protein